MLERVLLPFCCLGSVAVATAQSPIVVAESPELGTKAWLGTSEGLVLTGWPGAPGGRVVLGAGAFPRFDGAGNLYFERDLDDGHRILSRSYWRLPRGATVPAPVPAGRDVPAYRLPLASRARGASTRVCVDAGHGGSDPGAIGIGGLQEKDVTLDVCLKLQAWLDLDTQDTGGGGTWSVRMTRVDDSYVGLSQRANIANAFGAQSFLSVHMNSFGSSSANGTETYCYPGQEQNAGGQLRNVVQAEALAAWGLANRGLKSANYAVLRETAMPASLLEGGFITSPIDIVKLQDPAARDTLALHCLYALQQHHGYGRYRPSAGPVTGVLKGVLYDVSQGAQARVGGGLVALADGTFGVARSSDGYFELTLPAGSYTYAATAAGFAPGSTSRTVPAGGEVWGSIGLSPANVPPLGMLAAPAPGASLGISVQGDPGSPVVLVVASRPGLPLLDLGAFGLPFGVLWPDLQTAATLGLGSVPAGGTLFSGLRAPAMLGASAHCQAIVRRGGGYRTTNGAAFLVQ